MKSNQINYKEPSLKMKQLKPWKLHAIWVNSFLYSEINNLPEAVGANTSTIHFFDPSIQYLAYLEV